MSETIILTAPFQGLAIALDEVPDPVFAGRMMGDGVAIDPLGGCLHAPCDATVLALHDGRHAITLAGEGGVELLIHIGIDTVALGGQGFRPRVAVGDRVERGQPLIEIDLDALALAAPSLRTPVIVTNAEAFRITRRETGRVLGVGETLMHLERLDGVAPMVVDADADRVTARVVVPLAHGIHARPAARIGEAARGFVAESWLAKDGEEARTRSTVALMSLAIRHADEIEVIASGDDATQAVAAIVTLIESGMGEAGPAEPLVEPTPVPVRDVPSGALAGTTAAPGLAIGTAQWLRVQDVDLPVDGDGAGVEQARLEDALAVLRGRLSGDPHSGGIAAAHLAMLDDPELIEAAQAEIAIGRDAGHGWRTACRAQAAQLRATGDARIAERADDLLDLERQLIAVLTGVEAAPLTFPPGTILLADDLLPSQVAALDDNVVALAVERGGPTSHVAILAATRGLPAIVALGTKLTQVADGAELILDADDALLHVSPAPDRRAKAEAEIARRREARAAALAAAADHARTRDGTRIEAFANLGSVEDARVAIEHGAEGSGLLRTEFLFLDRAEAPDLAEQTALYQEIADALDGKPLIVRLLDVGGDKPAPYLPIAPEENPALGLRGIRVGLAMPDLLDAQLRAILSVRPHGQCRIMVPMIASVSELLAVRERVQAIREELDLVDPVPVGIMVETPAAAVTAATLARHADFLSVGTNDLTQYALAMDRGNPAVAGGVDGLHPAVLRLIALTEEGAARHGRWVGVCGGLASDRLAVPLLVGLGVTELSAAPRFVPELKALVRRLDFQTCRDHAGRAMALESAAAVRALARQFEQELPA